MNAHIYQFARLPASQMQGVPLGTQLMLAHAAVTGSVYMDPATQQNVMQGIATNQGIAIPELHSFTARSSFDPRVVGLLEPFKGAIAPAFTRSVLALSEATRPYDEFRSSNLINPDISYPDLVKSGLMTFVEADDALDAVLGDMESIFKGFMKKRYSRKAMAKRSFLYKVGQISLVGLTGIAITTSPYILALVGGLGTLGIGMNELRLLRATYRDVKMDLLLEGRDVTSVRQLMWDYAQLRFQRRGLIKLASDMSVK